MKSMKWWFSALLTVVIVLGAAGLALLPAQARDRPPDEPPIPHSLTLTPATAEGPVPGPHRVVATVRDRDRNPLELVPVNIVVRGPEGVITRTGVTDRRGEAPFSWTRTLPGSDTAVAFADGLTARASKVWVAVTPSAPAVRTPVTISRGKGENVVGTHHWLIITVLSDDGQPLEGVQVTFQVTGANPTSGVVTTDASGRAGFSYHGGTAGSDTITVTAAEPWPYMIPLKKRWVSAPLPPPRPVPPGPAPRAIFPTWGKAENVVCTHHWMIARLFGIDEKPLEGVQVTFQVTGVNPTSGVVTTDAYGWVAFSYHGGKAGFDTITVTAGTLQITRATRWVVPVRDPIPATGKTDGQGNFAVPLPFPGATASGRLVDPQGRPLPDRDFTLVPVLRGAAMASPEDIVGFTVLVAGHIEITVTRFSRFSLFGLTSFLLGDVRLAAAP